MTTFILLHGAWHGGWCWRFVAPALRYAGHNVYTPTLTGLGERAHLARPEIDLKLHVQDVVALLEMEDLQDIVLLGDSYGGMVVTGVADRCAARISRLVYLDAFVPENGKCALDYIVPERAAAFRKEGEQSGAAGSRRRHSRYGALPSPNTSSSPSRAKRDNLSRRLINQFDLKMKRRSRAFLKRTFTARRPRQEPSINSQRNSVPIRRGSSLKSKVAMTR